MMSSNCGGRSPQQALSGLSDASKLGDRKKAAEKRSLCVGLMTRCGVDNKRPFVSLVKLSAVFNTRLPGMGSTSIQSVPQGVRTCNPLMRSCATNVNNP